MAIQTLDILVAKQPGKVMKVPYHLEEPVYFLTRRVSFFLGETAQSHIRQSLHIRGIPLLDPAKPLSFYRVCGVALTYFSEPKNDINILFRGLNGKTMVKVIPDKVHSQENFSPSFSTAKTTPPTTAELHEDDIQLIFNGKHLSDGNLDLIASSLVSGSTVHARCLLRGGGGKFKFADVSQPCHVRKLSWASLPIPDRTASYGTNIEGRCPCTPEYAVVDEKHFGCIELSTGKCACPRCLKPLKPVTVGFALCKYRFHGIKYSGEQYTSD
ncbi:hypothetical protein BG004_004080 [Podila humilis]|nr:hypothetical protein BG004_004080 [Podila humilis]